MVNLNISLFVGTRSNNMLWCKGLLFPFYLGKGGGEGLLYLIYDSI